MSVRDRLRIPVSYDDDLLGEDTKGDAAWFLDHKNFIWLGIVGFIPRWGARLLWCLCHRWNKMFQPISISVGMGDIPCFVQERGCCSIDDIGFCFKRKFPIESQLKNDPNHHFLWCIHCFIPTKPFWWWIVRALFNWFSCYSLLFWINIYYLVTQQVLKAIVAYSFSTQLVFLSSVVARIVQFQITQDCAEDKPYQEWP